ncbi:MAG: hypothetical protein ACI8RZ_005758 [Myxococcota bacterium]|jgi:hypothetical protein
MGSLHQSHLQKNHPLDSRVLIGRSRKCDLRLPHPSISGEHALIWWNGERWQVRDLGSRNGTSIDGAPLAPDQARVLQSGDVLSFGHYPVRWTVASTSPPAPRAVSTGGVEVVAEDGMIVLPNPEAPTALIYADPYRGWVLEAGDEQRGVSDQESFTLDGEAWLLHLPIPLQRTVDASAARAPLETLALEFTISADEEHVQLRAVSGEQIFDLGSRAHHYALLTLARQRLEDCADPGLGDDARGWVYQEDLAGMLRLTRTHLNLHIFRARKQLAALNIANARDIIERRADSRQLRIGSGQIRIHTL